MSKIDRIKNSVCRFYSLTSEEIKSKSRRQPIPLAKSIVCYLSKDNYTTSKIGSELNIDHSTVVYHQQKISGMCQFYPKFAREIETIKINSKL
jgi:chromosomal replication initiation ATPase DnaA